MCIPAMMVKSHHAELTGLSYLILHGVCVVLLIVQIEIPVQLPIYTLDLAYECARTKLTEARIAGSVLTGKKQVRGSRL